MKILLLDTYYPAVLTAFRSIATDYWGMRAELLGMAFGTSDFMSRGFRAHGCDAEDLVANCEPLQRAWENENPRASTIDRLSLPEIAEAQVRAYGPDVLYLHDVSFLSAEQLRRIKALGILVVAQVSCPMPPEDRLCEIEHVFTSFPHYHAREFPHRGIASTYMRLAFDSALLDIFPVMLRDIDVAFVGGVGDGRVSGWWRAGTAALEALARAYPSLQWYGYGLDNLAADSPLRACYRGEAWGLDMYRIYRRARIVVNRHGEVAEDAANNMRLYEAAGCGALVVTEARGNLPEILMPGSECLVYDGPEDLPACVGRALATPRMITRIADAGQTRVLAEHTFIRRCGEIAAVLGRLLVGRRSKLHA